MLFRSPAAVQTSIQDHLLHLQKELARLQKLIREHIDDDPELRRICSLLQSIPGVGEQVSAQMTAVLSAHTFEHAEQMAAYLGLVPIDWQSGTSVRARPRLSKAGPPQLRQLLFLPAVAAKACNPHVKAIYDRLLAKGKPKMVAIGAAIALAALTLVEIAKDGLLTWLGTRHDHDHGHAHGPAHDHGHDHGHDHDAA